MTNGRSILIVSNTNELSDNALEKLNLIISLVDSSNKEIHIFKQDNNLVDFFKASDKVKVIEGLSNGADKIIFNSKNKQSNYEYNEVKYDFNDIHKRAIKRFKVPDKDKSFDLLDYNTRREQVTFRRLKYSIKEISKIYPFLIIFTDNKDNNLLTQESEYGDGRFIYNYNVNKDKSTFHVGGCLLSENDFIKCITEVNNYVF